MTTISRRQLLVGMAAGMMGNRTLMAFGNPPGRVESTRPDRWTRLREDFLLDWSYTHLAWHLLASHPTPVRQAVERYRRALDTNPALYVEENNQRLEDAVRQEAARYLGGSPSQIALTDSTTMGLGLLYTGLRLKPNQEILTTSHDYYSTHRALELRQQRTGARVRRIPLYRDSRQVSEDEIVGRLKRGIRDETRALALTWVSSSTGVKLPLKAIVAEVSALNRKRAPEDRVLVCVDGVHGMAVEAETPEQLGVDFFSAGCHKWLFGPRGTGVLWGKEEAWPYVTASLPTFSGTHTHGRRMTPGGFHSFEHRWALAEAFRYHRALNPKAVAERIHSRATALKERMAKTPGITVVTPPSPALSAAFVCFDVEGHSPEQVVARLRERRILATPTPYGPSHARIAVGFLNSAQDLDRVVGALRALSSRIAE